MAEVDLFAYCLVNGKRRVPLTPTETMVADYLARNQGRVVSPREMMAELWNDRTPTDTTVVRMHIASIRAKAGDDVIVTRHRLGYTWGELDEDQK